MAGSLARWKRTGSVDGMIAPTRLNGEILSFRSSFLRVESGLIVFDPEIGPNGTRQEI